MLHPQLQQPMLYHPQQLQQQALPVINCTLLRQLSRHVKSKPCVSHAGKALIDSLGCKAGSWYTSNSNSWSIYRTPGSKQPFYNSCDDQCAAAPLVAACFTLSTAANSCLSNCKTLGLLTFNHSADCYILLMEAALSLLM